MAFVVADRVQVTVSAPGSATTITLGAAVTGFQDFAVIGNGNSTYYTIADQSGSNWEVGIGTYTASGTTLSRDSVISSSNGGALVPFTSGTKDVFVTYPAETSTFSAGGAVTENATTFTGNYVLATGRNGFSVGPITIASGSSFTVSSGQRWLVV